jgi:hypothetical protein
MKILHKNIRGYIGFILFLFSSLVYAGIPIANTGEGLPIIIYKTGDVIATFQGATPETFYDCDLYLELPSESRFLFNNKRSSKGSTINLGSFPLGTELKFRLHVKNTKKDFYTGEASRNPDLKAHARIQTNWKEDEVLVSFEDSTDFAYNDLSFSFTNATSGNYENIAKGKTVAVWGKFFTGGWGRGLSLTDEVVFEKKHQWDQGSIWWDEDKDKKQNFLKIFLGGIFEIKKIAIQVDNNDDYLISWEDKVMGHQEVVIIPDRLYGMDNLIEVKVKAVTDSFKIEHYVQGAGDGLYSVSEFKAFGYKLEAR